MGHLWVEVVARYSTKINKVLEAEQWTGMLPPEATGTWEVSEEVARLSAFSTLCSFAGILRLQRLQITINICIQLYTYIYRYVLCYKFFSLGHFQDYQVAYLLSLLRCLLWCSGMLPALLWREYEASPSGLRQALQVPAPRCSMDVEPLPQRSRPKLQSLQFLQSLHSCMLLQKLALSQLENH